ncbi:MAG: hypothetical protein RL693_2007 [Verrucomicrobiota bacterium]
MTSALSETLSFFRDNELKVILARIRERNVPPLVQFGVYGLCGGLATFVFLSIVLILSKTLIPAYEGMMVHGHLITDEERAHDLLINNCIAFAISNAIGYITNVMFVFKSGRHHRVMEFFYFTFFNLVSFGISQLAGPWLIKAYGVPTNVAILTNVVASVLLNFVLRKFFVFKG